MLEQLTALLAASLGGGGAAILVLLTLGPLLTRKVPPHWRYWAWAVVAVSLMAYPILGPVLGALLSRSHSAGWSPRWWLMVPMTGTTPIIWITSGSWRPEQGEQGGQIPTWAENQCGTVITSTIQTGRAGR